ncbi:MAG TPA: calcium-binding protein [Ramlibacter sp.]|nr:calcium-binding protein [Ramlibacter sp.]
MAIFNGTLFNDTLLGGSLDDIMSGFAGLDWLLGDFGNDSMSGGDDNDTLHAGPGNDTVAGDAGDDELKGGTGNDTLNGGTGNDLLRFDDATGPVTVNLATGTATGQGTDTLTAIEDVVGSNHADSITGDDGPNSLVGQDANDTLASGAGNDTLHGGRGNDSVNGGAGDGDTASFYDLIFGATGAIVDLVAGTASDGTGGTDTLTGIEHVKGGTRADSLTGNSLENLLDGDSGDDTLIGGAGNDTLKPGEGADSVVGGEGFDTADYSNAPDGVTVFLDLGQGVGGGFGTDSLSGIEGVQGSVHNDALAGTAGDNALAGGEGNDWLRGGAGNDSLVGGPGKDIASFSGTLQDYTFFRDNLTGNLVMVGPDGQDTLVGIETAQFGDKLYDISGMAASTDNPEAIQGSDDADLMGGGGGDDTVSGGGGDDTLYGDDGNDDLNGDAGNDSLHGGDGDDDLDGGTGADQMSGGSGSDTYRVDQADDVLVEPDAPLQRILAGQPLAGVLVEVDTVISAVSWTLGAGFENLTLAAGTAAINGTGNASNNVITGNDGANVLAGLAGNDTLTGGGALDSATYTGTRSQYTLASNSNGFEVNATQTGEGTDTVSGVERLHFSDKKVALDLDGNAGHVAKLLGAVFGPASVDNEIYVGIGLNLLDGGSLTYEQLMPLAIDVALGGPASNGAVVDLLYFNLIGAPPDAAAHDLFTGMLDRGELTQGALGVAAANTYFNTDNINLTGLAAAGLEYV